MTSEGLIVSVTGANGYPIVDLFDDLDLQEGIASWHQLLRF